MKRVTTRSFLKEIFADTIIAIIYKCICIINKQVHGNPHKSF